MGAAPIFRLFPAEKFDEFKASIHSVPKIYKRRMLGIFPIVREVDQFEDFINTHTKDISEEIGAGLLNSIGYWWFNEYLIYETGLDLFSAENCALTYSTDGRGGKTYYAVYDQQQSRDILEKLNQLRISEESFEGTLKEIVKSREDYKKRIDPPVIKEIGSPKRLMLHCNSR